MNKISLKINNCFEASKIALKNTLVDKNEKVGWRQFPSINDDTIGTYGTACCLSAYCILAPDDLVTIKKVQKTLVNMQLSDGSWESLTIISGTGLTSATYYVIFALLKSGLGNDSDCIKKGINWIVNNISPDGGIGNYSGDKKASLISSALSLRVLGNQDHERYKVPAFSIIEWLINEQHDDGGFGITPEFSTLHHTLEVSLSLIPYLNEHSEVKTRLDRAIKYINNNWKINENIFKDISYVESDDRRAMLPHSYFTDGLLLQLYLLINPEYDEKILELVNHLVKTQKNGFWYHGSMPDKPASWATLEAIISLNIVKTQIEVNNRFIEIESSVLELKKQVKTIAERAEIISNQYNRLNSGFSKIYELYSYRFIIIAIYLCSIYLFIRNSITDYKNYADWFGFGLALLFGFLQIYQATKKQLRKKKNL